MLRIHVPAGEFFNESTSEFIYTKEQTLQLEHSLVAISKWESKWEKPFLTEDEKDPNEILDYIRCMTVTQNVDPNVYLALTNENVSDVTSYINKASTATTVPEQHTNGRGEIVTSELIYYWMIAFNIPFECQKWHLNRLLTLIKVCSFKNAPEKKMSPTEIARRNRELNEKRKKQFNTKG